MCITEQKRTLKKEFSGKIYDIFDKNDICKFVKNKDFLDFLCSIDEFYELAQKNDDDYLQFVDRLNEFTSAFGWTVIAKTAYGKILPMLKKDGILDEIDVGDRPSASLHITLYHLGMIGFDYKKLNS